MRRLRPVHVGWLLFGASLLLVGLNAAQQVRPVPDRPDLQALLRIVVGLPVVLLVPGWFLVPRLVGKDASLGDRLDPGWAVIAAVALTLAAHVLHFNLLRLFSLPIEWPALSAIAVVECALGAAWWRWRQAELAFASWQPGTTWAVALGSACVIGFSAWSAPSLLRDGSWYFFEPDLPAGWSAAPDGLTASWEGGEELGHGAVLRDIEADRSIVVSNATGTQAEMPVLLVVHAPVGTEARLELDGAALDSDIIARVAPLTEGGLDVERYWEWGSAALAARLAVPAGGELTLQLHIAPPSAQQDAPLAVASWAGEGSAAVLDDLQRRGFRQMHPFQLLNVTENIRWADEVAGEFVLAGRSPDGSSTLHQPPAWTYLYAPARELLTDQTVSAGALLVAILLLLPLVGVLGLRDESGIAPAALGLVLGFGAVQHGRLMVSDGSLNFPDSLYALALVIAVVALAVGRVRIFVLWAVAAALLRYPGAVVTVMAGGMAFLLDRSRRRRALISLARFGLILAMVCGVMLVVGALSGSLQTWFFALYFETVPEHFRNHADALPWLSRPPEFLRLWALFGGGVVLLGLPLRGRLSKLALGTALLYFPFLAFIDHFSHHYFLPLVGLVSVATCASIALVEEPKRRQQLAVAAAVVAAALASLSGVLKL